MQCLLLRGNSSRLGLPDTAKALNVNASGRKKSNLNANHGESPWGGEGGEYNKGCSVNREHSQVPAAQQGPS